MSETWKCLVSLQAHRILSVLGDQTLFVTERGRLVGFLTWTQVSINNVLCVFALTNNIIFTGFNDAAWFSLIHINTTISMYVLVNIVQIVFNIIDKRR